METNDRSKILEEMRIGLFKLVKDWLDKYDLPYKDVNIKQIVDEKGNTKEFEILLDNDAMLREYENDSIIPAFIKNGRINLKITL